jgi:hypothetical protein
LVSVRVLVVGGGATKVFLTTNGAAGVFSQPQCHAGQVKNMAASSIFGLANNLMILELIQANGAQSFITDALRFLSASRIIMGESRSRCCRRYTVLSPCFFWLLPLQIDIRYIAIIVISSYVPV